MDKILELSSARSSSLPNATGWIRRFFNTHFVNLSTFWRKLTQLEQLFNCWGNKKRSVSIQPQRKSVSKKSVFGSICSSLFPFFFISNDSQWGIRQVYSLNIKSVLCFSQFRKGSKFFCTQSLSLMIFICSLRSMIPFSGRAYIFFYF